MSVNVGEFLSRVRFLSLEVGKLLDLGLRYKYVFSSVPLLLPELLLLDLGNLSNSCSACTTTQNLFVVRKKV